MTLRVAFYDLAESNKEPIGYILWDGKEFSTIPEDDRYMTHIIHSPAFTARGVIKSDQDPEKWLRSLSMSYRGSYIVATEAEEVE